MRVPGSPLPHQIHPPAGPTTLASNDAGGSLTADWLWRTVEAADAAFAATDPEASAILRVTLADSEDTDRTARSYDLGCRPLGDDHPLDVLLGFVAPDDWLALGVASTGQARSLQADPATPGDAGQATPVRVTMLLGRSGTAVTLLRRDGRVARIGEPPQGLVADACRRAIGLPTAPVPQSTCELWMLWWLDRLVMTAFEPGMPGLLTGWAQVAALHPAAWLPIRGRTSSETCAEATQEGHSLHGFRVGPEPDVLAAAAIALSEAWPWTRLRDDPDAPEIPGARLHAELAAWMDDGMYARWLLSSFPSWRDLLDAARAVLPHNLTARVEAVVEATLS
jgi:hypothetical protein